jgi:hypothetical protein
MTFIIEESRRQQQRWQAPPPPHSSKGLESQLFGRSNSLGTWRGRWLNAGALSTWSSTLVFQCALTLLPLDLHWCNCTSDCESEWVGSRRDDEYLPSPGAVCTYIIRLCWELCEKRALIVLRIHQSSSFSPSAKVIFCRRKISLEVSWDYKWITNGFFRFFSLPAMRSRLTHFYFAKKCVFIFNQF